MKQLLWDNILAILGFFFGTGGTAGYILERKKRKSDAFKAMQDTYDRFIQDSNEKFESLKSDMKFLKTELDKVIQEKRELEIKYQNLKMEFENYKRKHP